MKRMNRLAAGLMIAALISGCAGTTAAPKESTQNSTNTVSESGSTQDYTQLKDALKKEGFTFSETTGEDGALVIDALNDEGSVTITVYSYENSQKTREAYVHEVDLLKDQQYQEIDDSDTDTQEVSFYMNDYNNVYTTLAADSSQKVLYVFEDYLPGNRKAVDSVLNEIGFAGERDFDDNDKDIDD